MTPARARVLEFLQQSVDPVTASDLARHLGQHANTVREHLDALVERGLAVRSSGDSHGRGRPAWRFSASGETREPDARVRDYAALALVLAEHVSRSSRHPEADARAAGRAWGGLLTDGSDRRSPRSARGRTVALLDEMGFDPLVRSRGDEVLLRRCPLLDVAIQQSQVVCSAHLGMIAAAFEAHGGDPDRVGLVPFAEAGGCLATFAASGGSA
ncbi:MAG: MarR family transcriptional regulator [Candidatus Nanopelagicales bacterium]|nr:MarR family transcriptional regulator [Candidatus Nanopelagicales bacterium]MCF8538483.1 MarR family transcriptional regulator [Candidatus Nanopelagicales bacterium]MCF8543647.1 MarR family transcriptional regulator [Candidatus Nanopelagicales bacterium]MCF8558389.1 MarR family transcriptional regulator [Candidatus Nanopelagicales bacterium]